MASLSLFALVAHQEGGDGRLRGGLPGVEVVEIVAICHASRYRWAVGNAVFGAETAAAAAWVEPLKDQLYAHGAAPVLAALATLPPTTEEVVGLMRAEPSAVTHANLAGA
jgi:hypothetical protein